MIYHPLKAKHAHINTVETFTNKTSEGALYALSTVRKHSDIDKKIAAQGGGWGKAALYKSMGI